MKNCIEKYLQFQLKNINVKKICIFITRKWNKIY